MNLFQHYFGARRNAFLEYDYLHEVEGKDELKVRFIRFRGKTVDFAETVIPACASWNVEGFNEDELGELKAYLRANAPLMLEEAELTRDGDAGLVEVTFEVEEELWVRFCQTCYLQGLSPEQALVKAIEDLTASFPSTGESERGISCKRVTEAKDSQTEA